MQQTFSDNKLTLGETKNSNDIKTLILTIDIVSVTCPNYGETCG